MYAWLRVEDDDEHARTVLRPELERWLEWGLFPAPAAAAGVGLPLGPGAVPRSLAAEIAVVGDPPACAASARRFVDAGATSLVLVAIGGDHERQYERFARDVLPRLQGV